MQVLTSLRHAHVHVLVSTIWFLVLLPVILPLPDSYLYTGTSIRVEALLIIPKQRLRGPSIQLVPTPCRLSRLSAQPPSLPWTSTSSRLQLQTQLQLQSDPFLQHKKYNRSLVVRNSLSLPLVDPSDTWGNVATLCFSSALAQKLGKTTALGKLLGPPVTAMALSFFLASVGVINPGGTQVSKSLQLLSLNLATPLMLLGADLQNCATRCGPLLPTFMAASFATTLACTVGWYVSGQQLMAALGRDGLIIAAALMAKNIGGGINYIAVCRCLSATPEAVAAGLVVDNLFALIYFPVSSALSAGMPDVNQSDKMEMARRSSQNPSSHAKDFAADTSQNIFLICNLLFLASAFLWLGEKFGGGSGALPCCTLITLLFALKAPKNWMRQLQRPAETLGTVCLYLFFSTAGAPGIAIADSVQTSLPPLSLYLLCLYGVHFLILWILHRFGSLRSPSLVAQRLLVASSAAIGGPATAVALAQANDWRSLVVPSLLVGNIGYAIATFCGLAFARIFCGI